MNRLFLLLLRKLLRMAAVVLGAVLIMFLLMHAIPGSPWNNYTADPRALASVPVDPVTQATLARHFGLDLPLWRQFTRYVVGDVTGEGHWLCGLVCGNMGPSLQQRGRTVQAVLFQPPEGRSFWDSRFGYSMRLVGLGAVLVVGGGLPLGLLSAARPQSRFSQGLSFIWAALISIPNFVLGLLVIIILASGLNLIKVLPDWEKPASWLIPGVVLALMPMASLARVTHTATLNVLGEDYVRMARAKGAGPVRVLVVHVLRTAIVPIIAFLGPALVEMFVGLFVIETLYAFPGLGREYWAAVLALDYPMILGMTVLYAVGIVLATGLMEMLSEWLDPRIRQSTGPR